MTVAVHQFDTRTTACVVPNTLTSGGLVLQLHWICMDMVAGKIIHSQKRTLARNIFHSAPRFGVNMIASHQVSPVLDVSIAQASPIVSIGICLRADAVLTPGMPPRIEVKKTMFRVNRSQGIFSLRLLVRFILKINVLRDIKQGRKVLPLFRFQLDALRVQLGIPVPLRRCRDGKFSRETELGQLTADAGINLSPFLAALVYAQPARYVPILFGEAGHDELLSPACPPNLVLMGLIQNGKVVSRAQNDGVTSPWYERRAFVRQPDKGDFVLLV